MINVELAAWQLNRLIHKPKECPTLACVECICMHHRCEAPLGYKYVLSRYMTMCPNDEAQEYLLKLLFEKEL